VVGPHNVSCYGIVRQNFPCSAPQKATQPLAHSPSFWSRRLGHRPEEKYSGHHILAGRAEDWGVSPLVLSNTTVDVTGATSIFTPVSAACRVSDQGLAELAEACAFFFEPGLQLVELHEVRAMSSNGGRCYPTGSEIGPGRWVGRWSCFLLPRGPCVPLGVMRRASDFQVEALS
jgi:hypothetical protein